MAFSHALRVRYPEVDQMGVVHHSQYVRYLEVARIEWLRHLGLSYRELEDAGALLVVVTLEMKYKAPARFDDVLEVEVRLTRLTAIRVVLDYTIRRPEDGAEIATGQTTLACVDRQGRLSALPQGIQDLLPPDLRRRGGQVQG